MRIIYSLAWSLALPFVLLRLWIRGRQEPGYRQHIAERLGFFPVCESKKESGSTRFLLAKPALLNL